MDTYLIYEPRASKLFWGLFYLFCFTFITAIILMFTLSINEKAVSKTGEIIAKNSPIKYLAPFDLDYIQLEIEEGSKVKKGDTLAYLHSEMLVNEFMQVENQLKTVEKNVSIYVNISQNLNRRVKLLQQDKSNLIRKYDHTYQDNTLEQESLQLQLESAHSELAIAQKNHHIDSALFADRVINKRKYDESLMTYLSSQKQYEDLNKRFQQEHNNKAGIQTRYTEEANAQNLRLLETEKDWLDAQKQLADFRASELSLRNRHRYLKNEVAKQYIVAEFDGNVRFLFNSKEQTSLIEKGVSILVISPMAKEEFYAKLEINQRQIKDIKMGQDVHLKLDAYDALKYGIVKGKVGFISDGDMENKFYVLVQIDAIQTGHTLRGGFLTKGEIILDRVKLYQFAVKKLFFNDQEFDKIDSSTPDITNGHASNMQQE